MILNEYSRLSYSSIELSINLAICAEVYPYILTMLAEHDRLLVTNSGKFFAKMKPRRLSRECGGLQSGRETNCELQTAVYEASILRRLYSLRNLFHLKFGQRLKCVASFELVGKLTLGDLVSI